MERGVCCKPDLIDLQVVGLASLYSTFTMAAPSETNVRHLI
jgi:hypothetical protein